MFFGIGSPSESEREFLFKVFVGEIGAAVIALFYSIFGLRKSRPTEPNQGEGERSAYVERAELFEGEAIKATVQQITKAGLTNLFVSRKDYATYRPQTPSIDSYIASAQKTLVMVSVNLMTGLPFDGLCEVLENGLESRSRPLSVTISLLNPWKNELMAAIGPVLETPPVELSERIKDTLRKLLPLKERLSPDGRSRFAVRVHNAIPFGSAIMIDHKEDCGRMQIETKPYKAPIRESFGFEITPVEPNGLFQKLCRAYDALVDDGETIDVTSFQPGC